MDWKALKGRFTPEGRGTSAVFRMPSTVLEIQPDFVLAAKLDGSARRVRRIGARRVETGSVTPNPGRSNIVNAEALRDAVRAAMLVVGDGGGQKGLLLSDGVVRAAILPFETIPESPKELEALVRWKMKQHLPYAPEEVRLSYQTAPVESGGFEVFALALKDSVVSEYDAAAENANGGLDLILPATAALLPLLPTEPGAQLLLSVCGGWMTSVVVCGSRVCFWRTREVMQASPEDTRRLVITEAARVMASARDHMRLEVVHAWFCMRPPGSEEFAQEIGRVILHQVSVLAPKADLAVALQQQERSLFEDLGAPVGGLLMNSL